MWDFIMLLLNPIVYQQQPMDPAAAVKRGKPSITPPSPTHSCAPFVNRKILVKTGRWVSGLNWCAKDEVDPGLSFQSLREKRKSSTIMSAPPMDQAQYQQVSSWWTPTPLWWKLCYFSSHHFWCLAREMLICSQGEKIISRTDNKFSIGKKIVLNCLLFCKRLLSKDRRQQSPNEILT